MHEALVWLEASALGEWMRTSGPWTYALVNTAHVLGIALLFGAVAVLDLRLLGVWRGVPLEALARPASAVAATGLAAALPSGLLLLSTQAVEYEANPFFWIKLAAAGLGVLNLLLLRRTPGWRSLQDRERGPSRALVTGGAVSLACWLTAVVAGRLIAYW